MRIDRMDGNRNEGGLGLYRLGYQILRKDLAPVVISIGTSILIAIGSGGCQIRIRSEAASPGRLARRFLRYIVTNKVNGIPSVKASRHGRVAAGEIYPAGIGGRIVGNTYYKDISVEVTQ